MTVAATSVTFRIEAFADHQARGPWLDLLRDIFAIDLGTASALNVWHEGYRAFSYWDGPVIAANISCRPLPLMMAGRKVAAGQIHAVATRPAYRRRGLFQDLMQRVLAYCEGRMDPLFLYTATPQLYAPFGFRPLTEHGYRGTLADGDLLIPVTTRNLSLNDPHDLSLVRRLFAVRTPASDVFGLYRNEDIFVANALAHTGWQLTYLAAEDVLVIWDEGGERRRLIDFAGSNPPSQPALRALLGSGEIDVLFPPDRLKGSFRPFRHAPEDDDFLMVRGPFLAEGRPIMLPLTALS